MFYTSRINSVMTPIISYYFTIFICVSEENPV